MNSWWVPDEARLDLEIVLPTLQRSLGRSPADGLSAVVLDVCLCSLPKANDDDGVRPFIGHTQYLNGHSFRVSGRRR